MDLAIVEHFLYRTGMVEECFLMVRQDQTSKDYLLIYFVPKPRYSEKELYSEIASNLSEIAPFCVVIALSALPLDSEGIVDGASLKRIGVIEPDIVREWERQLNDICGSQQVMIIEERNREPSAPLHLWDLLPDENENSSLCPETFDKATESGDNCVGKTREGHGGSANKLSISHGVELKYIPDAPQTLTDTLKRAAENYPDQGIIYLYKQQEEVFQSYSELLNDAQRILGGLRKLRLRPKDKVIFQFNDNREFLTSFWGCILGGFIPVPLGVATNYNENNASVNKLKETWKMMGHPEILASKSLGDAIRTLADNANLDGLRVHTFDQLISAEPTSDCHASGPSDVAIIMMTSGSTGQPKGVMLRNFNLLNRSMGSVQMNGFCQEDVSLNWMPLDHVAGIIFFHLRDVWLGCNQIQVPTELILQDPLRWLDFIERFKATITFAPNFAFALVNDHQEEIRKRRWDLSSMRFILNGAEAIVARTARAFMSLLIPYGLSPRAMFPAWGMSETSSGVIYSDRFSLETSTDDDPFVEVGSPIPGISMRIVDSASRVVAEGEVGSLEVRGTTVMMGYYERPELNDQIFTSDEWFRTGDLGFIKNGRLTITGREKDVIIINSINYYCHEIEGVVEQIKGIVPSYTAACALRDPASDTDRLAIFFHTNFSSPNELMELFKIIRRRVIENVGISPHYLLPVDKASIPKTEIGKIQRSKLVANFQKGAFRETLKSVDLMLSNSNTLPNWFFNSVWRPKRTNGFTARHGNGLCIVFVDNTGLGGCLASKLAEDGRNVILVTAGEDYATVDSNNYTIRAESEIDFIRLIAELKSKFEQLDRVFYLWPFSHYREEATFMDVEFMPYGAEFSLFYLVKALMREWETSQDVSVFVVASYSQRVLPDDRLSYGKAILKGIVRSVSRETSWLDCRLIDLPIDSVGSNADIILSESRLRTFDKLVAFRDRQRYVWRLKPTSFDSAKAGLLPFKHGGMYLVSGGLGGIGAEICAFMLKNFNAKLLLLGRTHFEGSLSTNGAQMEARREAYRRLLNLGGEIRYEALDICDLSRLKSVTADAELNWNCKLDGIIHLAGAFHEKAFVEENKESISEVFRPKIQGTWSLHQLIKDRPGKLFISFGSVNGHLGGYLVSAYAAANAFLDAFADYQRRECGLQSYCYSWSMWDEVGMSRGYAMKEFARSRGFFSLGEKQALDSWKSCLHHRQEECCIGLDATNQEIAGIVEAGPFPLKKCSICISNKVDRETSVKVKMVHLRDRFGVPYQCDFREIDDFPMMDNGVIDRASFLARLESGFKDSKGINAPGSELERITAQIWSEVLHREIHDIDENFFDVGGNSLLMAKVNYQINKKLRCNISMTELFQFPTIRKLAQYLSREETPIPLEDMAESQSKGAMRRNRMLKRRDTE